MIEYIWLMYKTAKHDNSWKQSYSIVMVSIKKVYIIMIVIKLRKMIIVQRISVVMYTLYTKKECRERSTLNLWKVPLKMVVSQFFATILWPLVWMSFVCSYQLNLLLLFYQEQSGAQYYYINSKSRQQD